MPTFDELLADKTKYPDEQKITLHDGIEVTVGQLRSGYARRSDMEQHRQTLARDRSALETERAALAREKSEAEEYLKDLAKEVVKRGGAEGTVTEAELEALADQPGIKKVLDQIAVVAGKLESIEKRQQQQDETLAGHERAYFADKHRAVLAVLKKNDPDLDATELVEFAKTHRIPYLDVAYRAYRHDHLLERARTDARAEGDQRGYERGKKEVTAPSLPPRRAPASLPADAPKTFEEAAEAALRDPAVQEAMTGL